MRTTQLKMAALAVCAMFALAPASAPAADTLAQAIARLDAKHVDAASPDLPPDESPKLTTGWDEEPGQGQTRSISQKNIKVSVTYRKAAAPAEAEEAEVEAETAEPAPPPPEPDSADADDETPARDADSAAEAEPEEEAPQYQVPIVTVTVSGRQVAKLEGSDINWEVPPVGLQIAELDPSNRSPEVVVSFYTGGAHCCSITKVVTANKTGRKWDIVDIGQFDGGPQMASDLDGDGRYEFADRDNQFLYAFGCYACSSAPLKVLRLNGDKIENVSTDPAYRTSHTGWLKEMVAQAQADEVDANAFLAGYVAEKILLGEGAEAWTVMKQHYNRDGEDGLEQCDVLPSADGSCPGRKVSGDFPESLKRFLNLRGYPARF